MNKANHSSVSVAEEFAEDSRREMRKDQWIRWSPVLILMFLILVYSVTIRGFFTFDNLRSLLNQLALPLIISVGVTFVILLGSINLSVEGLMAMAGSVFSVLVLNSRTSNDLGSLAILIVLLIGLAAGLAMGIVHVYLKLPSFMVTYAFSFVFMGIALLSYGGIPATISDEFFSSVHTMMFLNIPVITWIAFLIFGIALFIQKCTAFGQYIFAAGSNEKVLKSVGVNVTRVKMMVFMFSGVCLSIAGIISALRLGRGEILLGKGMMFPAFTAVVLGGTPMSGGRGGIFNTLIGAVIVTVLQNGMVMMGISSYIQDGIQGIIIVIAVILSVKRGNRVVNK